MIFYYPFPIPDNTQFGESMRLANMQRAFKSVGYEVEVVAGYARERQAALRRIRRDVLQGRRFEFVYAEASTWPMVLHKRNILHPFIDAGFFRWCRAHDIPVGLFYRDVYWRFPKAHLPWWFTWQKRVIAIPCYWYEWFVYRSTVQHLFLPSVAMANALPTRWPQARMSAAPPGAILPSIGKYHQSGRNGHVQLFYVGSIGPNHYDLRPLLELLRLSSVAELTLCCREREWDQYRDFYAPLLTDRVSIVHASGDELAPLYARSDVFALIREGNSYLDFAVPTKVFESLGYCLPIITLEGTEAARIIAQDDLGWVVADLEQAARLLTTLAEHPDALAEKRRHVEAARAKHTWEARAQAIADTLNRYHRTS